MSTKLKGKFRVDWITKTGSRRGHQAYEAMKEQREGR